jgi:hypothetical protein
LFPAPLPNLNLGSGVAIAMANWAAPETAANILPIGVTAFATAIAVLIVISNIDLAFSNLACCSCISLSLRANCSFWAAKRALIINIFALIRGSFLRLGSGHIS